MTTRRRLEGFALSELLVAVAIAGLIVGVLTFLNVDYIGFARRIVDVEAPYALGRRAEASADLDRCADPGAVLTPGQNEVVAQGKRQSTTILTLAPDGGATQLITAQGGVGSSVRPLRIVVQSGGMASIEVGDATVGVIAPRCDLAEVCEYDATNAACLEPDTNAADANATAETNGGAADGGGSSIAGHG